MKKTKKEEKNWERNDAWANLRSTGPFPEHGATNGRESVHSAGDVDVALDIQEKENKGRDERNEWGL